MNRPDPSNRTTTIGALYTCPRAAEYLGLPESAVRGMFNRRELALIRLGKRLYTTAEALDDWRDNQDPENTVTAIPSASALLDWHAVAAYLGLSDTSVRWLLRQRRLPVTHIGKRLYVRRGDLDAYITAHTTTSERADA